MNNLASPEHGFHPDNKANRTAAPQDPWAETPDHSGNLTPLPHMSPEREAAEFDGIVQDLKGTEVVTNLGSAVAPEQSAGTDAYAGRHHLIQGGYTGRHQRLGDTEFTPTPMSDIEKRNAASLRATLGLRETLRNVEPELHKEAKAHIPGPATEQFIIPKIETPAEPTQPAEQHERPAHYKSRHRLLGRFARLFSR